MCSSDAADIASSFSLEEEYSRLFFKASVFVSSSVALVVIR